jgi:hypothetical protein
VLDSDVVRQNYIVLGTVAKETDDRGMCAIEDSKDAALGALRTRDAAQTLNLCQNMIAMHGVLDSVGRDEDVAIELRHRRVRHDETIAVMVKNQAAFDFIASREGRGLRTPSCLGWQWLAGSLSFRLAAREAVPATRQFLDRTALFKLGEYLEQRSIFGFFEVETLSNLAGGRWCAPNLQKTQYVIRA